MISEVFFAGSCASSFYFYDQFVELYNAAAETLYLDNIIVTRQAQVTGSRDGAEGLRVGALRLPAQGHGEAVPDRPGAVRRHRRGRRESQAVLRELARSFARESESVAHPGEPTSCTRPSTRSATITTCPAYPTSKASCRRETTDFLINLTHNAVVIAEGGDYPIDENNYMRIPIEKVIDGVEYSFESLRHRQGDDGARRRGIRRHRRHEVQRPVDRAPGAGLDTNNSTFDFVVIPHPTPGYFYGPQKRVRVAMKRSLAIISVACAGALLFSCGLDKPDAADGRSVLVLQAVDTSGVFSEEWTSVANAKVECSERDGQRTRACSPPTMTGKIVIEGLPMGDYYIQASMRDEEHDVLLTGQAKKKLRSEAEVKDTLFMSFVPMSPIVINEIYYAGCNGSSFYYYDQFVELYNSTSDTLYLDGYVICRSQQSDGIFDIEGADFALAYYMYQFPGTRGVTHQCPIAPKSFLVIACDAINHHNYGALCVNLLGADWEFFNPTQNDYDNLLVPNLLPVSTVGKDFTHEPRAHGDLPRDGGGVHVRGVYDELGSVSPSFRFRSGRSSTRSKLRRIRVRPSADT